MQVKIIESFDSKIYNLKRLKYVVYWKKRQMFHIHKWSADLKGVWNKKPNHTDILIHLAPALSIRNFINKVVGGM